MQFPSASSAPKKREVLAKLAKVYDPLGLASPITLQGKQIYRLQSIIGRSYPREPENTLAKVGAVTSGGSNHTKTFSTLSTTSHLR